MQNTFLLKLYGLTERELEVVNMVGKGSSNKQAASELFVTEKTVKFHLTNIYRKMGVSSRSKMIVKIGAHAYQNESPVAPI